jgi:hypothetical protein
MITIEDVLKRMMRVPKRGLPTLAIEVDTFLRRDNAELRRAYALVLTKVPAEARPWIQYLSTNYHRGKWRHSFMLANAHMFGHTGPFKYYHVPFRANEKNLPLIMLDANYYDPVQKCRYMQHAAFNRRSGKIEIFDIMRFRKGKAGEEDMVVEAAYEMERLP